MGLVSQPSPTGSPSSARPSPSRPVTSECIVRPMTANDWPTVKAIYEAGIATGNATFETEAPSWDRWNETASA